MFEKIKSDFRAVFEMDPAATSRLEVIFTYAGFHAILMHRIAHWLYKMGMPFFARVVSQTARFLTGIEVHPAARIGGSFFIDHGMGVVIGETTEIGEHVTLFQGVTLGGTGKERGKRHPTIGNYVVVGTGAKVLGGITVGDRVKIGANAVVLRSVPPNSTVVGVPGRVVRIHGERTTDASMLDHLHMPDPLNETLVKMQKQITRLEQRLDAKGGAPASEQPKKDRPDRPERHERHERQDKPDRQEKRRPDRQQGRAPAHAAPAALPEESVQERQARMARMEREERMKLLAFRKPKEAQPGEGEPQGEAAEPAKKRVRRRRRGKKGGGQAQGAPGAVGGGGEPAAAASEQAGAAVQEEARERTLVNP